MKIQTALGSAFVIASTLGLYWQDPAPPLQPVPPGTGVLLPPDATPPENVEWSALLSSADLDARADGFWRAHEALPSDAGLRALLEAWSADPGSGELAWTARLLLELEARGGASTAPTYRFPNLTPNQQHAPFLKGPTGGWPEPPSLWGGGQNPFQGLFGDDPLEGLFGTPEDPFGGLDDPFWGAPLLPGGADATGESMRIELTPEGVRVHIDKADAEGTSTEVYEAESLEALEREHPELFADGRLQGLGAAPPAFGGGLVPRLPLAPGGLQPVPPTEDAPTELRTDVLGVYAVPVTGPGGVAGGLRVQAIEPRSIAAAVGLAPGDTLVRLGATPIETRADVAQALSARAEGAALEVEWVDAAGATRIHTWKP